MASNKVDTNKNTSSIIKDITRYETPAVTEFLSIIEMSSFNEEEHPRGQPDNAGEFVKKGKSSNRGMSERLTPDQQRQRDYESQRRKKKPRPKFKWILKKTEDGKFTFEQWVEGKEHPNTWRESFETEEEARKMASNYNFKLDN